MSTDPRLIESALRGDASAVSILVGRLMPIIRARVHRALWTQRGKRPAADDAQDIMQDVWLSLIKDNGRQLRAYDPSRGASLETYVGLIAEREVGNRLQYENREKRSRLRTVSEDDVVNQLPGASNIEESTALKQTISGVAKHLQEQLPDKGRLVWKYSFVDECTVEEICGVMKVSAQVVYNWQHKIRKLARELIDGEPSPNP